MRARSPVSAMVTIRSRGKESRANRSDSGSTRNTMIVSLRLPEIDAASSAPAFSRLSLPTIRKFSGSPLAAASRSSPTRSMLLYFTSTNPPTEAPARQTITTDDSTVSTTRWRHDRRGRGRRGGSRSSLIWRADRDMTKRGYRQVWAAVVSDRRLEGARARDPPLGCGHDRSCADMAVTDTQAPAKHRERWTAQWKELYAEVIETGLCTGCAGCVISCPHDVIGYTHAPGAYKPFHLEDELGPGNCIHGEKGCTTCTRACPRFRSWEPQADEHLFARTRQQDEVSGIYQDILLTRASDDMVHRMGQDGGLVSALLIWALDNDYIDGALTSFLEGEAGEWKARPGVAANKDEVLASAGSRYTYSANTLAIN